MRGTVRRRTDAVFEEYAANLQQYRELAGYQLHHDEPYVRGNARLVHWIVRPGTASELRVLRSRYGDVQRGELRNVFGRRVPPEYDSELHDVRVAGRVPARYAALLERLRFGHVRPQLRLFVERGRRRSSLEPRLRRGRSESR